MSRKKGRFSSAGRNTGPAEHSSLVDYLEKTIPESFIAFSFEIGTPRKISGGVSLAPRIPYFQMIPFDEKIINLKERKNCIVGPTKTPLDIWRGGNRYPY